MNQNQPQRRSWGSVADYINIILAVAVIFLSGLTYNQTTKATDATVKADSIATEALRLSQMQYQTSIQNEEDARAEAIQKSIEDERKYRKQFGLDSMGRQAQVDAFRKQEERFEVQNEPNLQIFKPGVRLTVGKTIYVNFDIKNLGTSTVKGSIISGFVGIIENKDVGSFLQNPYKFAKIDAPKLPANYSNFTQTDPINKNVESEVIFEDIDSSYFYKGLTHVMVVCNIGYTNPINKKEKIYSFIVDFYKNELIEGKSFSYNIPYNANFYKK